MTRLRSGAGLWLVMAHAALGAPAGAPCGMDNDCDGDLICEAGRCAMPALHPGEPRGTSSSSDLPPDPPPPPPSGQETEAQARSRLLEVAKGRCPEIYDAFKEREGLVVMIKDQLAAEGVELTAEQQKVALAALGSKQAFVAYCLGRFRTAKDCDDAQLKNIKALQGKTRSECLEIRSEQFLASAPFAFCARNVKDDTVRAACAAEGLSKSAEVLKNYTGQ